ncbi:MAG TPA: PAS domain S-box protein [Geobacteraceae bacterium]
MDKPVTIPAGVTTARIISPLRLFVLLLVVLFVAEAIIMFMLPLLFPTPGSPLANFADSLLLITLSAPFIWILIVQPLRNAVKTEAAWAAALLEHVVDGVVIFDCHGIVASLNPAAEQIFGYSTHEGAGQHMNRLLNGGNGIGDFSSPGETNDPEPIPQGDRVIHDIQGRRKDGSTFPMDFSVSKVFLAGETAFIGIARDTTERKRIEAAMIEKQYQLAELNVSLEERVAATVNELREKDRILIQQSRLAAMGELINNIAHQWRQPLNTLGMLIQRLPLFYEMGGFDKEFLDSSTGKAMKLVQQLSRTIDDFGGFFRPDREKSDFSVNRAVSRAIDLVQANLIDQKISLDMNLRDDPHVNGYKNEYSQAILVVLLNARDVLVERKIDNPVITVTSFSENDRSVVVITDNGGGIHEDIMDRIFDPYFTTKGPDVGMGIGLFMAKSIIEKNMSGRIAAHNIQGGAEFRIEV